jgi:tripartite-type tricarboxylate transporter receptor subunit TctC
MTTLFRQFLGLVATTLALTTSLANAQDYPTRPVRIFVGYAAGGATDIMARQLAERLTNSLKQQFIVENKPGASSMLAAQAVAQAAADGHTLFLSEPSTLTLNPFLFKKLLYDPNSFAPVSQLTWNNLGLVVPATSPAKTVEEFVALAKTRRLSFASGGTGNITHIGMELFIRRTGIEMVHVPYKGSAPLLQDMLAGQIDSAFIDIPSITPYVLSRKLRLLAIASPARFDALPDIPTFSESGYSGFAVVSWFGLLAPANTPSAIITLLNSQTQSALASEPVRAWIKSVNITAQGGSPEELAHLIKSDAEKYSTLIRELGITLD